jgi:hypothetical protein
MTDDTTVQAEQRLNELASAFAQWRQSRPHLRQPIPQALWDQAIALSEQIPIRRLSQRLRLSASDLRTRRRLQQGQAAQPSEPTMTWIDVPLPTPSPLPPSSAVTVELERPDGARLRLHYAEPPELTPLVQSFFTARTDSP